LLIIGFCGGFSTFSTFSNETIQLFQQGNASIAVLNILVSLGTGFGIIYLAATK
jgi:CrcB protein